MAPALVDPQIATLMAKIADLKAQIATILAKQNSGIPNGFKFNNNLKFGQNLIDVKYLQMILNSDPDTKLKSVGLGSSGRESTYFGKITVQAVIKFQNKYAIKNSDGKPLVIAAGLVGPITREKLNNLLNK